MTTETEVRMLQRLVQTGDADAFSEISRLYAGMVYGTCLRITGDEARAADAAQETFFQLLKSAGQVTGSLGSWLHRVATRRAVDLVRQDAARRRREEAFAASALQETDTWAELSPVVDEAMDELEEEQRELLIERFLRGQTTVQMAAVRGVSQPTMSRRVDHALSELRERLRNKGVLMALPILATLMGNTAQAAPAEVLAELGKMSLTASGAAASAAGTASEVAFSEAAAVSSAGLLASKSFQVAMVSAVVVTVVGIGGFAAYRLALTDKRQPSTMSLAQRAPGLALRTNVNPTGPRRLVTGVAQAPPQAVGAVGAGAPAGGQAGGAGAVQSTRPFNAGGGATRVTVRGGGAVAVGFGGVATGLSAPDATGQVNLGRTYGNDGDWRRAFECFQKEIASGGTRGWSEWEWAWATSSALAAGETNACRDWCRQLLDRLGNRNDPDTAERCAKLCLALPGISGDLLTKAAERADFAIGLNADHRFRQLVKGMAEYRRGHWSNALEWLQRPERSSNMDVSIHACGFAAMARYQLGDADGARSALDGLNRRLNVLIHTGELGDRQRMTWDGCARAVALRAEAERLMLGKEASLPLDPSVVVAQRKKWPAVLTLIRAAEQSGRQGKWAEARDRYAQALAHPEFDWDPMQLRSSVVPQQIASAFLLAGDEARHRDLCRALLERPQEHLSLTMQERNAWVYLIKMDHLPPDLKTQALATVRKTCERAETENSSWVWLICGLAAYREGRPDDALFALDWARFGRDVPATARMLLCRALALQQAGRTNDAATACQDAQGFWARTTPQAAGWWNQGFYQMALQEFRALQGPVGEKPKPR